MERPLAPHVRPAALLALALAGCRTPAVAPSAPQAVRVALVERAAPVAARRYSAHIEPASRVELAFKVGGYVDALAKVPGVDGKPRAIQEGDRVEAGREVAALRRTEYAQKVAEAKAAEAQAQAAADQAQLDEARATKLADKSSLAQTDLDLARTKLASARAVLAGAKARVAEAETALADTSLRAPMSGVVVRRAVEVGSLAGPGTIAVSIADVGSVKAVFGVPDTALSHVRLGATQSVTSDALPGVALRGRITRLAPSADPKSRTFEAEVLIPNDDDRLKIGMVVSLALGDDGEKAVEAEVPLVPLPAIVRPPGGAPGFAVFVVDATPEGTRGTIARLRVVELGDYLGRVIPVKRGLAAGERVVVQGAGLLADGERVEVVP